MAINTKKFFEALGQVDMDKIPNPSGRLSDIEEAISDLTDMIDAGEIKSQWAQEFIHDMAIKLMRGDKNFSEKQYDKIMELYGKYT